MIVSTTLLGKGTAGVVHEALRSVVMLVDACIVIDTGADADDVEAAKAGAGSKYVGREWSWMDDFGAARNEALEMAKGYGAKWALTLDTDERIKCVDRDALRADMAVEVDAIEARHETAGYVKPRLIRLPCRGKWRGPNHEGLFGVATMATSAVTFTEAPRAPGHMDRKWRRNLATLMPYSAARPREQRWHYYIAEAHAGLGNLDAAIESYRRCVALQGWSEEGAWAAYRCAKLMADKLKRFRDAIEMCARGMARHAGMAELPTLAAICAMRLGDHEQAIYWASLARVHGEDSIAPVRALEQRIGFRNARLLRTGADYAESAALKSLSR